MIASILPAILHTVGKVVDRMFPDEEAAKQEKLKLEPELLKQLQAVDLAQLRSTKLRRRELPMLLGCGHPLRALAIFCESSTIRNSVSNPSSTTNM